MSLVTDHGLIIGKEYTGEAFHRFTVKAVEHHYGNISIHVYNHFYSKTEWMSVKEWNDANPKHKIVRP